MIGQTVAQYKILEKIGAGGMGEVFLAEDTNLHRKVALKFLPDKFGADPEFKSRFEHEARAAAALNHPNIITVFDLGEHEGRLYIAMEHVAGQTLAELIDTDQISIRKALELGSQICDGLNVAHNAGIVHRDIKPANILVDESGRARILDFGLAKSRKSTTETKIGSTVGTVQYESPEQSRGEQVDNRSDLFSFGSVLYEMITGRLPFPGDYDEAIRYSISHEPIEPLARYKSGVPTDLESVIAKLLEKEPEMRYQTASGVIADLKRIQRDLTQTTPAVSRITPAPATATQTTPEPIKSTANKKFVLPGSIVVVLIALALVFKPWKFEVSPVQEAQAREDRLAIMYFDNLTDPEDTQRQGEIVANLLIADISASTQLKVVSSQRLYDLLKLLGQEGVKKIDRDVASQVAKKSNARWMLTGNILRTEPTVVLTAQLVEVETGTVLTSSRIDGAEGEDIFSMVDKLTDGIAERLNVPASTIIESPNVADLTTTSAEAYRYYLEGVDLKLRFKRVEARAAFEKSIELDSSFAMSYFWLSHETESRSMMDKAMELRNRVGEMDRLRIESRSAYLNRDYETTFKKLEELIEKYPEEKSGYLSMGYMARSIEFRDFKKSVEMFEKALEIDPLIKNAYNNLAYDYEKIGEFDKSIWAINKYIELAPDEPNPYDSRAELQATAGRLEEAVESFQQALRIDPEYFGSKFGLAQVLVWQGKYDEGDRILQELAGHSNKRVRSAARWERVHLALHRGQFKEAAKRAELALESDALDSPDGEASAGSKIKFAMFIEVELLTDRLDLLDEKYQLFEAAKDTTNHPFEKVGIQNGLATVAALMGDSALAWQHLAELEKVIDTSVYIMRLFRSISIHGVHYFLGDYQSAIENAEWALEETRIFPASYYLGRTYLKAGEISKAVDALEHASERYDGPREDDPIASARVHYLLGQAYEATGWNDKAIQQYEKFLDVWKDADDNIIDIKDARERLARLKA